MGRAAVVVAIQISDNGSISKDCTVTPNLVRVVSSTPAFMLSDVTTRSVVPEQRGRTCRYGKVETRNTLETI